MNKRQRKKLEKKHGDVVHVKRPRRLYQWRPDSPLLSLKQQIQEACDGTIQTIIIDSISELWEQMRQDYAGSGAIDVSYELVGDQPDRPPLPSGSDDRRRRLAAPAAVPPARGEEPMDHAPLHGRGSQEEGN